MQRPPTLGPHLVSAEMIEPAEGLGWAVGSAQDVGVQAFGPRGGRLSPAARTTLHLGCSVATCPPTSRDVKGRQGFHSGRAGVGRNAALALPERASAAQPGIRQRFVDNSWPSLA